MSFATSRLAGALFGLAACTAVAAQAGAGALHSPSGLAVDTTGNLYVANATANSVTVYDRSYALVGTLTQGLNVPTSVAVSWAHVYVTNAAGNSITMFAKGGPNNGSTLTDPNLTTPLSSFFDPIGVLWVLDSAGRVHAYNRFGGPIGTLAAQPSPAHAFTIAASLLWLWGGSGTAAVAGTSAMWNADPVSVLTSRPANLGGVDVPLGAVAAAAADALGNQYLTDPMDKVVAVVAPLAANPQVILGLSYAPFGIAVDNVGQRLYVSDLDGNAVHVYSLKPPYKQLHVIR